MVALVAGLTDGLYFGVYDIVAHVACGVALTGTEAVDEFDHARVAIFFYDRLGDLA